LLITHAPLRLQRVVEGLRREDLIAREATDPPGTAADGADLRGGESAAVAPDRARLAPVVGVDEFAGRSEVKGGEGARFTQEMTIFVIISQPILTHSELKQHRTYGLGRAGSSSKALTSGECTGTFNLYGRRSPIGLCERPR